uniref:Right handed beta helix domain-containing protein n=2 Tax=Amphimedon queenslandica TaxID=400682 RepID=A0A1X7VCW8_AMPQE
MSLLLVVVLLLFSSSCSVSSGQYYVSDDCSSVPPSPCNPLSVYAGNISQYNNTTFYFIGITTINDNVTMTAVKNVTLHGLDQSPSINCNGVTRISLHHSNHITISNLLFSDCPVRVDSSSNVTITNSVFASGPHEISSTISNAFDVKILSVTFTGLYVLQIYYVSLPVCSSELLHYSLVLTNVTFNTGSRMKLDMAHGTTYNVSIIFDHVQYCTNYPFILVGGLFYSFIINSSFHGVNDGPGFFIDVVENSESSNCTYPSIQIASTFVIEDSRFYNNKQGLKIISKVYLLKAVNYHIIIKSCLIYDNINEGLFIDGSFMRLTQIDILDTELIGNGGNKIVNSNRISLSNFAVANSTSTGLTLERSFVTIKNNLIFKNNTGVVGGGLAINGSSRLIVSSSANLEFIDNHAYYKGGGIYAEESTLSDIMLMTPNIPLTLINNSAGMVGGDMYGVYIFLYGNQFKFTHKNINSTSDAEHICFCDPHTTSNYENCLHNVSDQYIYPGQALKFNVALFGLNYFKSKTLTDGTVQILNDTSSLLSQTQIPNTCSLIECTPKLIQTGQYQSYLSIDYIHSLPTKIFPSFIVKECPIGFSIDKSQGSCTCSQSVSRENVKCDINNLNITHNGLLWIGTYDTSTPFNANATNPNACIITEDCLLYCSPNFVTFQLNDTDTQCVDNRGHRMCGSCTEGYSLLMGSNKCGQCHNYHRMIGWIALFAVMGVLLVVLLIALNLTVSVGTLNGLLFYANIVKLYEPVFSRKGELPVLHQVLSWINLDFGFEICFYNGMDSYVKQWLQFAFPIYLWIIIIIIIQLCRRYGKISRLMGSHAVPVLSTLTFLSYTKLVRTIVIVLRKREVTLHCTNESVRSVSLWYEDPNVEYAKGKHAGLFGFALLVSVFFVIPYTLFLLCHPVLEKYLSHFKLFKSWSRFKPIIDAYSGPMKDEYRFWPGLLLVARIPVLLTVTFLKNESYVLLLAVAAIILSLSFIFAGVYRKKLNNVIEFWFLLNLCIMAFLSIAFTDESKVFIWYNTCLSVFIVSFILIVVYHLYLQLSHMKCYDALIKKLFKKQEEDNNPIIGESHLTVDQQMSEIVSSSTDVRLSVIRESVVELF